MTSPAFFLDRDGVINKDTGYLYKVEEFEFLPGVMQACKTIQSHGYKIIIVTNQAGIARGYYSEEDFARLTEWMLGEFKREGIEINDVYYCPHHPEKGHAPYVKECQCRKPAPGMLLKAAQEHNIALETSYMVGDKLSDMGAGHAAGVKRSLLVASESYEQEGHHAFEDLNAAVKAIFD